MGWKFGNHFSLFLSPRKQDIGKLKSIMDDLRDLCPDVLIPRPDYYTFPICICQFPFPRAVPGEKYPDTLEKHLSKYYAHAKIGGYPNRQVRFQPKQLRPENDCIYLTLSPATQDDEHRLTQLTDMARSLYPCEPCEPTITLAQLFPGIRFPSGRMEMLKNIFEKLNFETTADLHTLTLVLRYSPDDEIPCSKTPD